MLFQQTLFAILALASLTVLSLTHLKDGNLNKDSPPTVEISSGVISRWTRRQCLEFARAHPLARYRKLSRDRISISA
jgi:hypothetical protein